MLLSKIQEPPGLSLFKGIDFECLMVQAGRYKEEEWKETQGLESLVPVFLALREIEVVVTSITLPINENWAQKLRTAKSPRP